MGRHASDNPASDQIRFRVRPEDKAEIRRRADAAGVSMAEYLIRCALGHSGERA